MSKIDEKYFGTRERDYPWPGWSNGLGDPPRIRLDDLPGASSPYLPSLKAVLSNIAAAARQEGADALRDQLKTLSDKTIVIHPVEGDAPNRIFAARDIAWRGSRTLSPPLIEYNPQRWERYVVETPEGTPPRTAIASPEQLLLGALAGYGHLYQAYVDHMEAASPATPAEERRRLYQEALALDALGYDRAAIARTVNASMKSAVPGFQERSPSPAHYAQSEPLPTGYGGIPAVKPEEQASLETALKIRRPGTELGQQEASAVPAGILGGSSLQEVLMGIPDLNRQLVVTRMLQHADLMCPAPPPEASER